nr:hypothetical protein [Tanacetum cinerariifolium]
MNDKIHTVNVDNFRDMLQIYPKLPCQKFEDPPFEKEILSFIRDLGHIGEIKVLPDVNVNHMHQPGRSFTTIINKCLSEAYQTYYAYASGEKTPKPKYVQKKANSDTSPKQKPVQAPKGKHLKATAKVPKSGKKKLPALGLETLSEIALSKAEQMKLATKRSKTQFHSSYAHGSGRTSDDEDDDANNQGVDDDADNQGDDNQDDDNDDQDDDNEQTESNNDDDIFVYLKLSMFDEEDRHEEKLDEEQEVSDHRIHTPSHVESTDDEAYDEVTKGNNEEEQKLDEEKTNKEEESSSVSSGFISNMLNPNPDISIDFILNLNAESTSLVDVPVTTNVEISPSSVTTLPPPSIPLVRPQYQTPVPTPTIVPNNFSEFKQTNPFADAISSILAIIDSYLANKMNEVVKTVIQLQSDILKDEDQAKNEDFINKHDENIKKIIKEQVKVQVKEQVSKILPRIKKLVNEQLKYEVLTRSSNEAKTSHVVAAKLSELELKKILIDKMEHNKLIHRSDQQKTLYKALVDAYETDKVILETYEDTVMIKRRRDNKDEDEEPSAGLNRGSKRQRAGKEPESSSLPKEKTSKSSGKYKEGSKSHQKSTGKPDQVEEPKHNTLPAAHGPIQPWISNLARKKDTRDLFNELMDTPLDFSAFVMNRLKVDTLTPELLASLTFELMKGSSKSLVELEYFLEEVNKATTDQLDWNNPEG